ncbi:MAG TPA: hypothetical protein VKY59_11180 [Spirillospora sp.]|nr:hypothetical protein [Spirillospora sp.]
MTDLAHGISLLWPDPLYRRAPAPGGGSFSADLNLDPLIDILSIEGRYRHSIENVLARPITDPDVLDYRLDVIEDLLRIPELVAALEEALAIINVLESYMVQPQWEQSELRKVAWRLSELENYINCIEHLTLALGGCGDALRSAALCSLRDLAGAIASDPLFNDLKAELPPMLEQIRGIQSITIGVNLDSQLRPVEATLLSVNTTRFTGESMSFFNRLLGLSSEPRLSNEGIGPLHKARSRSSGFNEYNVRLAVTDNPLMHPLFKDLADVMNQVCQPIAHALRKFVRVNGRLLVALQDEIAFYLGAIRLIRHLENCGLPMCRPQVAPQAERIGSMTGLFNLNLALRMAPLYHARDLRYEIVVNDVNFGDDGRIFILTGPNRGGKTTYTQAVGLAYVMMQAGLFVPAASACLSPVDNIFTHFAAEERPDQEAGRLGEEAKRLSEIFAHATRHSLLLFNESLASTSAGESLYLARDIVRVMRLLGVRAIFSTHLHELAADADEINAETEGDSKVVSLVSMVTIEKGLDGETARRTYKIVPSPPMGRSYAREIAIRYGISYDQLKASLQARSQIPLDEETNHHQTGENVSAD